MKPIANPNIVFREEFDSWAILFNPNTGDTFGLNPVSFFIWKHLDGINDIKLILSKLLNECSGVPNEAEIYIKKFINQLIEKDLASLSL